MWGPKVWDSDAAADWFAKTMQYTQLHKFVRDTLESTNDLTKSTVSSAQLRAAAYCVHQLGHVMVWPIDQLGLDLNLSIQALEKVLTDEEYCYGEEIVNMIIEEKQSLEARLIDFRSNS